MMISKEDIQVFYEFFDNNPTAELVVRPFIIKLQSQLKESEAARLELERKLGVAKSALYFADLVYIPETEITKYLNPIKHALKELESEVKDEI